MKQTRLESVIESLVNIIIGYGVAILSQRLILPMVGIHVPLSTNLIISFWFTLISLVRSYVVRRWFNAGLYNLIEVISRKLRAPFEY